MSCTDNSCNTQKDNSCSSGYASKKKSGCATGCDVTDMVLNIAHDAWEELMREKMKAHYEKNMGEKMDKTAEAAVLATMSHWKNKMKAKAEGMQNVNNLRQTFM